MVDTFVHVNLESGPGVDSRLLFPGSIDAKRSSASYNTDDTQGTYSFTQGRQRYYIEYTGSNFGFTNSGSNLSGNISGATLYEYDANGNPVEIATMSITDSNGDSKSIAMDSASDFTQNSPQNSDPFHVTQFSETGDTGADILFGSGYNDVLSGYGGHDTLTGGDGNDKFEFIASGSTTYDFVTDFTRHHDKLDIDTSLRTFGNLHNSNLANVFHDITNSSETSSDRLLYNHNTGALFYDRDGAGGKAPTEIAVLTNHAHINYSDIKIIG